MKKPVIAISAAQQESSERLNEISLIRAELRRLRASGQSESELAVSFREKLAELSKA